MTRPTIEDVLARTEVCGEGLFTATADGPRFSADGTVVVHRADPELAKFMEWEAENAAYYGHRERAKRFRRVARLLATDPEGES